MGEYEDRYPDAFGRGEEVDSPRKHRHFFGLGLPRQVRDSRPAVVDEPQNPEKPPEPAPPPPSPPRARAAPPRPPSERRDAIHAQQTVSPLVDAADIAVSVNGSDMTLDGTRDSLAGLVIALAKALPDDGDGRVRVRLRVRPPTLGFATEPGEAEEPALTPAPVA